MFEQLYQYALLQAEMMTIDDDMLRSIGLLKVIDGSLFPVIKGMTWVKYRKHKNALKIHIELCINTLCVTNYIIQDRNSDERKPCLR